MAQPVGEIEQMKYISTVNDHGYVINIDQEDRITVDDQTYEIDFKLLSESGLLSLLLDNLSVEAIVEERDDVWEVLIHGELYSVQVQDERAFRLAKEHGSGFDIRGDVIVKSPMPGLVIEILVGLDQAVEKGEKVVILESMKMENELRSPLDGFVSHIYVEKGANVEKGQALITIASQP
jgi:acetyl/propionyl-CoA carboxylase alpha subunit